METTFKNKSKLNLIIFFVTFISLMFNCYFIGNHISYNESQTYLFNALYNSYLNYYELNAQFNQYKSKESKNVKYEPTNDTYNDAVFTNQILNDFKEYDLEKYYINYLKMQEYYGLDSSETLYDYYDKNETEYLFRCVETEVYGGDFESKVNVANVILNRLNDDRYPNTIKDVVTSPNQFTYHRTNISESTIMACEYAFMFEDTTNGALAFHSGKKTDTFCNMDYIFTDNVGHNFYSDIINQSEKENVF